MSYDLSRFHRAQARDYAAALSELRAGRKRSHWIWYIFPQLQGLGYSSIAQFYAIEDLGEARAYLADDVLRERLETVTQALLDLNEHDPGAVMGYPDDLKLRSSMTLFREAAEDGSLYQRVLDQYYGGEGDPRTLALLKR